MNEEKKAPRYCSITLEPMFEGFCVCDGAMYIKLEKDATAHVIQAGYKDLDDAYEDEYIYFTDWHDIPLEEWDDAPKNTDVNFKKQSR